MFTLDDLKEYLEQRDAADTTFFINTLRTVPYMGNKAPIIVFPLPL